MEKISKKFGMGQAVSLSFGVVVGMGIYFKTPDLLAVTQNNVLLGLLAWIVGGIFVIIWACTVAEFAGATTETGGMLTYIRCTGGDLPAFIYGWGTLLIGMPSLVAVLATVTASFTSSVLGLEGKIVQLFLSLGILAALFLINMFSAKAGGKMQLAMTIIKVIPLALFVVFGLFFSSGAYVIKDLQMPLSGVSGNIFKLLIAALIPVTFSFSGWDYVATVSGEVENAKRNVPKAIIISVFISLACYVLVYLGFVNTVPIEQVADAIPFGIAQSIFGSYGGTVLMLCIIISALGALNGIIIGSMRFPYGLAIKNLFIAPEYFSAIDEKTQIPLRSSVLMLVLSAIQVVISILFGMDFSSITVTINTLFTVVVFAGVIIWRREGKIGKDTYRTPLFPIFPILAIVTTIFTTIGLFLTDAGTTRNTLIAMVFYGAAIPVFFFMKKSNKGGA